MPFFAVNRILFFGIKKNRATIYSFGVLFDVESKDCLHQNSYDIYSEMAIFSFAFMFERWIQWRGRNGTYKPADIWIRYN